MEIEAPAQETVVETATVPESCYNVMHTTSMLIGFSMAVNCLLSLIIIAMNAFLIYKIVWKQVISAKLKVSSASFTQAIRAAEFARIHPIGIAVIAEIGGVPLSEVIEAYEKDSMERRAIVYQVMGGRTAIAKKFVDQYRSNFMLKGYEGEADILNAPKG